MLMKDWLTTLKQRLHTPARRRKDAKNRRNPAHHIPAQTEILEDRTLLAAFIVDTLDDVVADDGFVSLREAIEAANTNTAGDDTIAGDLDGDTITFDASIAGGTISLDVGLGQLEITDDLVIDGEANDITVSGQGQIRIFSINTSTIGSVQDVSLSNITLTAGNTAGSIGDDGGAIFISDGETVTLDFVTILSSTAAGNGGAIFNGDGTLNVNNSQIGNEVVGADVWSNGGATTDDAVFAFVDTQDSTEGTAATLELFNDDGTVLAQPTDPVAAGVEVVQSGSVFSEVGGGFDEVTPYQIYTSVVDTTTPTAETEANDTAGTADPITEDTLVTGDLSTTADEDFFSIMLGATDDTLVVMLDNDPEGDTTVTDAVIEIRSADGTTLLASSRFAGFDADAAIATELTGSTTYTVRILSGSGGTASTYRFVAKAVGAADQVAETEPNNDPATADALTAAQFGQGNLNFAGGNSAVNGGGIYNDGGALNLDFTSVNNNTATGNSANFGGGGIYSLGGDVLVDNSSAVEFNSATGTSGSGGGILVNGGSLTVMGGFITNNSAVRAGGGIETNDAVTDVTVQITDSSVEDNSVGSAPGNGGGLHVTSPSTSANTTAVTVTGGNFSGNFAASEGGGLWNDVNGTLTVNGVLIDGNTASGDLADNGGGGVFNNGGTVVIQSNLTTATTISGNIADGAAGSGGGILNDGGTLTIDDAVISNNTAIRAGGGIEVTTANSRDSLVTLNDVTMTNNFAVGGGMGAPGNGGGVHISDATGGNISTFTVNQGTFSGNSAAAEGGGLWNAVGGTLNIDGASITGNIASGDAADQGGGGIFNDGGIVNITAIAATAVISNNLADGTSGSGGGILNDGGTLNIDGAVISNNNAIRAGGGIEVTTANSRDSVVTVFGTTIQSNTVGSSPGNGGGVHISDAAGDNTSTFTITNSTVSLNSAAAEGGGLWNDVGGTLNINGTTISNNIASGDAADQGGGGIFNNGGNVIVRSFLTATVISGNIADGTAGSGGGILNDGGTLTITGAEILNNTASRAGGGIEVTTANLRDSNVTLNRTRVASNVAASNPGNGGGVHISDAAGDNTSTFTVNRGSFEGNFATSEGGGLWNDVGGTLNINGTLIEGNTASGNSADQGGGGIFNNGGTVNINNLVTTTIISDNVANGFSGSGGGILNDGGTLNITGAILDGNTAVRAGGGIEVTTANGRDSVVTLTDSILVRNHAIGGGSLAPGNGGGVHISDALGDEASTFTITGGAVVNNFASAEGGGLWNAVGGTLNIDGTLIESNTASGAFLDQGGGGIFNEGGTVNITNTTGAVLIIGNVAGGSGSASGGGILNDGGTLNINGATIDGNAARRAGGGIEVTTANGRDSIVNITDTDIVNNAAGPMPGNGGGVHISDAADGNQSTFNITGGIVSGNFATAEGGGLWNDAGGTLTISGVVISSNTASGDAADQGGGGVFNNGGIVIIQSGDSATLISDNVANGAAGSGGGILNDGGTLTIDGATIDGNSAVRAGGGVEVTTANGRDSDVTVTDTTISTNTAGSSPGNGGGVHISDASGDEVSTFTITDSTVTGNSAASEGGGLWNDAGGTLTIMGGSITSNTASGDLATNGGGGIFNNGGIVEVVEATVSDNTANGDAGGGGGIFNEGGILDVADATISDNTTSGASGNGGGVFNDSFGLVNIVRTTISGNAVNTGSGGGAFNEGTFFIDDSTVSANSAATDGGGIFNGGTLELSQVTVSGNTAAGDGGGVYTGEEGDDIVIIENSTITLNAAIGNGGGVFNDSAGDLFLESTIVAGNTADSDPSDVDGTVLAASGFNLIGVGTGLTGITDGTNDNLIGTAGTPIDALLEPLADNGGPTLTHDLAATSPAINAGSNPDNLETDQRADGFPRTIGPQTDIGAIEAQLRITAVGSGQGDSRVRVFNSATGDLIAEFSPYGTGFLGEIRVAVADINGDGTLDVITGAGPGGGPHVKVLDGLSDNFSEELFSFFAFNPNFLGGVFVAGANFRPGSDINADIVVASGANPHVIVYSGADDDDNGVPDEVLQSFFPYDPNFTGGVRVATGDITGDSVPDIITAPGPGGGPHIRVFDGAASQFTTTPVDIGGPVGSFFAYDPGFLGGVFVASGDINGDDRDDIITAPGAGGGPNVRVFSGLDGSLLQNFNAYDPGFTGGVTVGSNQSVDNDGIDDIVTGPGPGGGPNLRVFSGATGDLIRSVNVFDPDFTGGIFVAGGVPEPLFPIVTLRFGGGLSAGDGSALSQAELDSLTSAALVRLEAAGASASVIEELSSVNVRVSDLDDGLLGVSFGSTILIDSSASGAGWFIDPTPLDDAEFDASGNATLADAIGRVDLLTAILHEFGHQLGADDLGIIEHPENLMADSLPTGRRRSEGDLDALFADNDELGSLLL